MGYPDQVRRERRGPNFPVSIPDDLPLGDTRLSLDFDVIVAEPVGNRQLENRRHNEHIGFPLTILSPDARETQRLIDRAQAAAAWLVVFGIALVAFRHGGREPRFGTRISIAGLTVFALLAVVLGVLAMTGQLLFARPIMRTVVVASDAFNQVALGVWCLALVLGAVAGRVLAHRGARWERYRIRAIVGKPGEVGYREPAVVLPSMLSRDVAPCDPDQLATAIRDAGYRVRKRKRGLEVADAVGAMATIRCKRKGRWVPADLVVEVVHDADARPIVNAAATVYGPLAYTRMTA